MAMELYIRIRSNHYLNLFVILTRLLIGFAFIPSGLTKLLNERFTLISTDNPIGYYFEAMYQTGFYWQFIGFTQLLSTLLLMTQRFATLGSLIFLSVLTNIWLLTVSMEFKGTWIITSLMMLANLLLIIWDADKIKPLFLKDNQEYVLSNYQYPTAGKQWIIAGCILFTANLIAALISRYVPDHFIFIWAVSLIVSTSYVMILTTKEILYFRRASKY
jgi:uncharacterized membrane protein YphA (DoxX/SURF4 family)